MGAMELRTGNKGFPMGVARSITDQLDVGMLVELIGIRLQAENVEGESFESNWYFSDIDERHAIGLDNCAIHHRPGVAIEGAPSITCTKTALADAVKGAVDVDSFLAIDGVEVSDEAPLRMLFENLDQFSSEFGIVEP